jgi:peptidoglycan hydrolase-like protein with peptidoglycan-binding domain
LGFIAPASAGDDGARLRAGLRAFQRAAGLSESGVADQATRTRLEESYGG